MKRRSRRRTRRSPARIKRRSRRRTRMSTVRMYGGSVFDDDMYNVKNLPTRDPMGYLQLTEQGPKVLFKKKYWKSFFQRN